MAGVSQRERREVAERRGRVLRMKSAGMTLGAIADEIEKSRGEARRAGKTVPRAPYTDKHAAVDLQRGLEAAQAGLVQFASLHLALELERMDELTRTTQALLGQARSAGDRWQALRAVDRLLQISKRRDDLLGLSRTTADTAKGTDGKGAGAANAVDQLARRRSQRASAR
jgi:hypothetical protein